MSAAGAIYETAGRKTPGLTPQGARFVQQGPIYGRKRKGQDMRGRVLYRAYEQDEGQQTKAIFAAIEKARVNFNKRATVNNIKAIAWVQFK